MGNSITRVSNFTCSNAPTRVVHINTSRFVSSRDWRAIYTLKEQKTKQNEVKHNTVKTVENIHHRSTYSNIPEQRVSFILIP